MSSRQRIVIGLILRMVVIGLAIAGASNEAVAEAREKDRQLMKAVRNGYVEEIRYLSDRGADANEQDEHGWSVLMTAAICADRGDFRARPNNRPFDTEIA
ncbi:ankyrin repeat domain-containing protein [Thermodesulfobacteriota bacterium]